MGDLVHKQLVVGDRARIVSFDSPRYNPLRAGMKDREEMLGRVGRIEARYSARSAYDPDDPISLDDGEWMHGGDTFPMHPEHDTFLVRLHFSPGGETTWVDVSDVAYVEL